MKDKFEREQGFYWVFDGISWEIGLWHTNDTELLPPVF